MSQLSGRSLTLAYVCALAIIALMSLASHLTLNQILQEHRGAASVINVSGRQRMLSQRIAGLIAERALDLPVQADLIKAIDQLETAHHDLIKGNEALHLPAATSPELRAIYFEGKRPLDAAVTDFVRRARLVAGMSADNPNLKSEANTIFAEAREPILTGLDSVVSVHQATSETQLRSLEWMQKASLSVVIVTLIFEALIIFRPMVSRIARYTQTLMRMAATDPLTGALNRRSFTDRANAELSRARRYDRPTALLMIDADRFKLVNDRFGHAGGDAVLQALSASLSQGLRPSDLLSRLGGEEFAVLLAETDLAGAAIAAERLRAAVAALAVELDGSVISFTISIGVVQINHDGMSLKAAMDKADEALYQAKADGRDRVVLSKLVATEPLSMPGETQIAA